MYKKIKDSVRNVIFPSFSELELITLFFLILLLIIDHRDYFFNLISSTDDFIEATIYFGVFVVGFFAYLIGYAIKKHRIPVEERSFFSYVFYIVLSSVSIVSAFQILDVPSESVIQKMEKISILILLGRSLFTIFSAIYLGNIGKEHVYSERLTNEQLTGKETFLLILSGVVSYIWLRESHTIPSTLALSYFYVITLLLTVRELQKGSIVLFRHKLS